MRRARQRAAGVAARLGAVGTAAAREAIPAQAGGKLQQAVYGSIHLGKGREGVEPGIAVVNGCARALAPLQAVVELVVGGFAHGLQPSHPVERGQRRDMAAIEAGAGAVDGAVIAFLALAPLQCVDGPAEPAREALLRGVGMAQPGQPGRKRVLHIGPQRGEVLARAIVHGARVHAMRIACELPRRQVRRRVALTMVQPRRQRHLQLRREPLAPAQRRRAALELRLRAKSIGAVVLGRQVQEFALPRLQPQRRLSVQRAMRGQAHVGLAVGGVVALLARFYRHQPRAVEVAVQRGHGTLVDADALHLQRHDHAQVHIAVGMRHGLIQWNAVQHHAHVAAMAATAEAAHDDGVTHAGQLVVLHIHARHLAQQLLRMAGMGVGDVLGLDHAGGVGGRGTTRGLALDLDGLQAGRGIRRLLCTSLGNGGQAQQAGRRNLVQGAGPRRKFQRMCHAGPGVV